VEVTFAEASSPRRVDIYWSGDGGIYRNGHEVRVELWVGGAWQQVVVYQESGDNIPLYSIELPESAPAEKLRVVQSSGTGAPGYSNIMWNAEIEVFESLS
jgi:formylmethanofuran dehydrogenase subunit D